MVTVINETHSERLPLKDLKGLTRFTILPLSTEEKSVIKGCKSAVYACSPIIKVSLSFTDEKQNASKLFLYLDRLFSAIGPEKQKYILSDADVRGFVVKRQTKAARFHKGSFVPCVE